MMDVFDIICHSAVGEMVHAVNLLDLIVICSSASMDDSMLMLVLC